MFKNRVWPRPLNAFSFSRIKPDGVSYIATSLDEALQYAKTCSGNNFEVENVFVMGGQQIYEVGEKSLD